jgi:hypothetical protein
VKAIANAVDVVVVVALQVQVVLVAHPVQPVSVVADPVVALAHPVVAVPVVQVAVVNSPQYLLS